MNNNTIRVETEEVGLQQVHNQQQRIRTSYSDAERCKMKVPATVNIREFY